MFLLFIGNTGGSFFSSWQRGIPRKNPCTCDKNRPVVTGLLNVVFTPSFNNYFILSNCFTRRSYSCRKRNVCEMSFSYHGHLFTVKVKKFSDMKTIFLSRVEILWRVSTQARKVCYPCKDQESKVGAKFRTIYLKL